MKKCDSHKTDMGFTVCVLAHGYNTPDAVGAESIMNIFQSMHPDHQFVLITTTEETVALNPQLVIILLLKAPRHYSEIYKGHFAEIRDIAPAIQHLNVVCFGVVPYIGFNEFKQLIPEDIKNDPNDYTRLFESLKVHPNGFFHQRDAVGLADNGVVGFEEQLSFEPAFQLIHRQQYKRWLICYLMLALQCNVPVTQAVVLRV